MTLRPHFTWILIICSIAVHAQHVELTFSSAIAGYSMGDLKKINADIQEQLPFTTSVTSNFPATWQPGGQFAIQATKKYKIGVLYAYNSTGSRIASGDYSGSYRLDNIVTGHTIGLVNGFLAFDKTQFRIDILVIAGIVASTLKMDEEVIVADTTISSSVRYSALGVFAEPRAECSYRWKFLKAALFLGYFYNPTGKITNGNGEKSNATINWSGVRFGVEIGIHN
jgi:hypothetical protein